MRVPTLVVLAAVFTGAILAACETNGNDPLDECYGAGGENTNAGAQENRRFSFAIITDTCP